MVPIIIGSKRQFEGADPAFVLQCPGCEQETVWIDVRHAKSISINFIPVPTGTAHVVICSECMLSMPLGDQEMGWLRSLTATRSGVPLEECAGPSVAGLGVDWLEQRENEIIVKLRRTLPPLHTESRRLRLLDVPEETIHDLVSDEDDDRRTRAIVALTSGADADMVGALAQLVSKLDANTRCGVLKRIGAMGSRQQVPLVGLIDASDNKRVAKAADKALGRLRSKTE